MSDQARWICIQSSSFILKKVNIICDASVKNPVENCVMIILSWWDKKHFENDWVCVSTELWIKEWNYHWTSSKMILFVQEWPTFKFCICIFYKIVWILTQYFLCFRLDLFDTGVSFQLKYFQKKKEKSVGCVNQTLQAREFIYLGFYVTFKTVYFIS